MQQSETDLKEVLCRREIMRGQITLLKALYEQDDEFVSSDDLATQIRWNDQESLQGVLRAFGNRINHTDGIAGDPGIDAFVEQTSIDEKRQYRLRPEARHAIEDIPPLIETFDQPMETLLESGTKIDADDLNP
jgi:hypothetical protein